MSAQLLFLVLLYSPTATALGRSYAQYEQFFPAWHDAITKSLNNECKEAIAQYRDRSYTRLQAGYGVIDCILNHTPEFRKAEMAASAVILGLVPAALQILSPSYADTAVLTFRRPLLALLLAASGSAVRPLQATDFDHCIAKLRTEPPLAVRVGHSAWTPFAVSAVEYVFVALAVANNMLLAYQLGVWAVCTFVPAYTFLPAAWTCASICIHLIGWFTLRLRFRINAAENLDQRRACKSCVSKTDARGMLQALKEKVASEVVPSAWTRSPLGLEERKEGHAFYLMMSLLYVGSALQVLYGTAILSGLVFLSVRDSVIVALRYFASTLVCRAVLIYEFAGMRGIEGDASEGVELMQHHVYGYR